MSTLIGPIHPGSFVTRGISWTSYTQFADEIDTPNVRVTYDNGLLELMTVSHEHECVKAITARLSGIWAYEKDWPITGYGQMTMRRADLQVGIEADECYYVRPDPPPPMPGLFDLHKYPPPDLAIEIEVSRSAVEKVSVYVRLGVPEVWRWTGERFIVLHRQDDGQYVERPASRSLPDLPMDMLAEFVRFALEQGQPKAARRLRVLLRPA